VAEDLFEEQYPIGQPIKINGVSYEVIGVLEPSGSGFSMTDGKDLTSRQVVDAVVKGLEDKKGLEILFIDFAKLPNTVAEYFVIAHGSSKVHVDALADSVIDTVRKDTGRKPWNKEGFENAHNGTYNCL